MIQHFCLLQLIFWSMQNSPQRKSEVLWFLDIQFRQEKQEACKEFRRKVPWSTLKAEDRDEDGRILLKCMLMKQILIMWIGIGSSIIGAERRVVQSCATGASLVTGVPTPRAPTWSLRVRSTMKTGNKNSQSVAMSPCCIQSAPDR
jgi:hypothetical protein